MRDADAVLDNPTSHENSAIVLPERGWRILLKFSVGGAFVAGTVGLSTLGINIYLLDARMGTVEAAPFEGGEELTLPTAIAQPVSSTPVAGVVVDDQTEESVDRDPVELASIPVPDDPVDEPVERHQVSTDTIFTSPEDTEFFARMAGHGGMLAPTRDDISSLRAQASRQASLEMDEPIYDVPEVMAVAAPAAGLDEPGVGENENTFGSDESNTSVENSSAPPPEPITQPVEEPQIASLMNDQTAGVEKVDAGSEMPWRVQLASLRDAQQAGSASASLSDRHADLFAALTIAVERADLAKGTFYRVKVGPFGERTGAAALCEQLQSRHQDCFVVGP